MHLQKSFALIIPLLITSFTGTEYSTPRPLNSSFQISKTPPPAPETPLPPGKRVPGGTRNPLGSCQQTNPPITALMPENSQGKTISEHPIFWFYIPYTSEEITSAEFSLNDENENNIYRISFKVSQKPGIISIPSPPEPKYFLKPDQYYHWYLEIKCKSNQNSTSDIVVNQSSKPDIVLEGWVQRITFNPTSEPNFITPEIWYDFLTQVAQRRLNSPSNSTLNNEWTTLLKSVGLEQIAPEPLRGSAEYMQVK